MKPPLFKGNSAFTKNDDARPRFVNRGEREKSEKSRMALDCVYAAAAASLLLPIRARIRLESSSVSTS
jgi:hypothetical protein